LAAVDRKEATNSDSAISSVAGRFVLACAALDSVVFLLKGVVFLSTSFKVCGFFNSVDKGVQLSQCDCFKGSVVVGVSNTVPEFGLGK
jgi:hypothetical protein